MQGFLPPHPQYLFFGRETGYLVPFFRDQKQQQPQDGRRVPGEHAAALPTAVLCRAPPAPQCLGLGSGQGERGAQAQEGEDPQEHQG